jgi:hypothetical protein
VDALLTTCVRKVNSGVVNSLRGGSKNYIQILEQREKDMAKTDRFLPFKVEKKTQLNLVTQLNSCAVKTDPR